METPVSGKDGTPKSGRGPKALASRLLNDQRVRFLMVGGTNTIVGYVLFTTLWHLLGQWITYFGALYGSYALASILAFFLYRRFVFHVAGGNTPLMFIRFQSVYVVSLLINTAALPLLVEVVGLTPPIAQLAITVVTTIVSYIGHKFFSFRRKKLPFEDDEDPERDTD